VSKRISEALKYKQNVVDISRKMLDNNGIDETLKVIKAYLDKRN
jgi:hypothetical protein